MKESMLATHMEDAPHEFPFLNDDLYVSPAKTSCQRETLLRLHPNDKRHRLYSTENQGCGILALPQLEERLSIDRRNCQLFTVDGGVDRPVR